MSDNQPPFDTQLAHRWFAADLFNQVWTLLDKTDRTEADCDTMLHAAHASRAHWQVVGQSVHLARGEWQVSRVYSVLGRAEPALYHAQRCLDLCETYQIGDFDTACAHEALARAHGVADDREKMAMHVALGRELAARIEDADERGIVESDLAELEDTP